MKHIDISHGNEIKVNVLGINHFTWFDRATYKHMDLLPLFKKFIRQNYEEGFLIPGEKKLDDVFICSHRVKFDLFKKYGIIAAAGDRHLAEFFHHSWYLKDRDTIRRWKFRLTPVDTRIQMRRELNEYRKKVISGKESLEIKPSKEEGVIIMQSLLGLGDIITNVNIPNRGQMKGLPLGGIVESNALFTFNTIQPLCAGELPHPVNDLTVKHIQNHERIYKAAIQKDKDLAVESIIHDPYSDLDPGDAKKLFIEMLEGTKEYLDGWVI
jgi:alpha-galactosidase